MLEENSGNRGKFLRHLRGIRTTLGFGSERSQNSSSTRSEERKVHPSGRGCATRENVFVEQAVQARKRDPERL